MTVPLFVVVPGPGRSRRARKRGGAALLLAALLLGGIFSRGAQAQSGNGPAASSPQAPASAEAPGEPEVKPAPPTPIAIKKAELGQGDPWNPAWDRMIEKAIPRNLLSRRRTAAVGPLCPRFGQMSRVNRRAFWAYFFQALAGAEAGLRPTADVRHSDPEVAVMDTVTHRTVRQEGLLQLTYMDSRRYGCKFDWRRDKDLPVHDPAKTILQPRNNLLCGIRIVEHQLMKQHKPLLSESSYWVTLRPGHPSFQIFVRQMANVPAVCGSPLRHHVPAKRDALPDEADKGSPGVPAATPPAPAADPPGAGADPAHGAPSPASPRSR